jgi:hypothetical protein
MAQLNVCTYQCMNATTLQGTDIGRWIGDARLSNYINILKSITSVPGCKIIHARLRNMYPNFSRFHFLIITSAPVLKVAEAYNMLDSVEQKQEKFSFPFQLNS